MSLLSALALPFSPLAALALALRAVLLLAVAAAAAIPVSGRRRLRVGGSPIAASRRDHHARWPGHVAVPVPPSAAVETRNRWPRGGRRRSCGGSWVSAPGCSPWPRAVGRWAWCLGHRQGGPRTSSRVAPRCLVRAPAGSPALRPICRTCCVGATSGTAVRPACRTPTAASLTLLHFVDPLNAGPDPSRAGGAENPCWVLWEGSSSWLRAGCSPSPLWPATGGHTGQVLH